MPSIRVRGRVINKDTRQPIKNVSVLVRKAGGSTTTVAVDVDGEFDAPVYVSSAYDKYELAIDKDAGYRFKAIPFTFGSTTSIAKDFGDIELEPYTD